MPTYNTLSSLQIRSLLTDSPQISTAGTLNNGFSDAAYKEVTNTVFNNDPTEAQGVEYDSTGLSQTVDTVNSSGSPVYTFIEDVASTAGNLPSMTLATNGHSDLIDFQTGAGINFTDAGSSGDAGDVIYGDAGSDTITVTQGANFVVGGSGPSTIQGGSGADTLWGGTGATALVKGGSGNDQKLVGGLAAHTDDTLIAGTGTGDTLWAGYGNVVEDGQNAGKGEQLWSGVAGNDTLTGNGETYFNIRAGDENVSIHAGPNSSASDTIFASAGAAGNEFITTSAGHNFITVGGGNASLSSAGDDSISLINGGFDTVSTSGAGSDTIQIGASPGGYDSISGGSSGGTQVVFSANLNFADVNGGAGDPTESTAGGVTTIQFAQGTVVQFSGNVTIDPNTTKSF